MNSKYLDTTSPLELLREIKQLAFIYGHTVKINSDSTLGGYCELVVGGYSNGCTVISSIFADAVVEMYKVYIGRGNYATMEPNMKFHPRTILKRIKSSLIQ